MRKLSENRDHFIEEDFSDEAIRFEMEHGRGVKYIWDGEKIK
jgi:hypothetical protein